MGINNEPKADAVEAHPVPDVELPITYVLKKARTLGKTTYTEIVIDREPITSDFKGMVLDKLKTDDYVKILSRLTFKPAELYEKLHMGDMMQLQKIVSDFLA